jgi:2-polyprenyl-3-methyl-5-hydroxy-6-metoxy-1,4-benzoquinol methylase
MKRTCAVCGSLSKDKIHVQYHLLPGRRSMFTYDVVVCRKCGFLFADNIPSQKEYERYYKTSNKYTYGRNVPAGLLKIYRNVYNVAERIISKYNPSVCRKNYAILDIGCSIGSLLNIFKEHGFRSLSGVEPSEHCSRLAKELYGIDVFPGMLSDFNPGHQFDLLVMTGVLEHVSDFKSILPQVGMLLKDSGLLMVVVPDADNFSSRPHSPFDEFSMEHINYFTAKTLSNLMKRFKLKKYYTKSVYAPFYDSRYLVSFYKKALQREPIYNDTTGKSKLIKYIAASHKKLSILDRKFDRLIKSNDSIIVWGAGSLTYRLLATSNLAKLRISAFVDSNTSLHGKMIHKVKIVSPDFFDQISTGTVFIASHIYGQEIEQILRNKYRFKGNIITM